MQCDVDIVGEPTMRADVEVMVVGLSLLRALGIPACVMRVNNRKILDGLLDTVGIAETSRRHDVLRIVDKLPKIGRAGVDAELVREVGLGEAAITQLFAVLEREVRTVEDIAALGPIIGHTEAGAAGISELSELVQTLTDAGFAEGFEVDLSIARGLDYYTATIYETFLVGHEEYGSVMSGGRYDTLIGTFSKTMVPAVGISLGVDRLVSALLELGLMAERPTPAHVFIALFDQADYAPNMLLAARLREFGVKSELSLKPAKLGKQFKLAERKGHRFVLLAGADEHARGEVQAKDLSTGEQRTLALSDMAEWGPEFALNAIGNKD
jgi:histidyl-tRNA synthetase